VALGGFFFGLVIGKIVVFWLQRVFNDAMVEITITLASTYLTYYIGEEVLGVSGVLAVVMLGIEINSQKTSISPEVEVFLHKYVCSFTLFTFSYHCTIPYNTIAIPCHCYTIPLLYRTITYRHAL
jgi:NhaP-type Na+/H+ or K+/H+ antiporter